MAMTSSFLSQSRGRPPRYRTPSPPRRAVEPISPVCHPDTRISWNERSSFQPSHTSRDSYSELNDRSRGSDVMIQHQAATTGGTPSSPKAMGYSHHRSSSNIETLANIALATSPTFAPRQHESYQGFGPMGTSRWSYPDDHYLERPTKRMRSDRVSSPQAVSGGYQTPSHDSVSDSMKTDAELLLNFARPSNFIPRPSTTATHPPLESKWPTTAAPIPQEQQPPVHFAGNGISPSRHRSHSDGAMALERPPVPELRPNTSSSTLAPNSWNVEPKTEEAQPLAASSNGNDNPQEATPHQSASSAPQDAASEERKEESDSYDSSQGTCAECNMSRADGAEDQTEDTWIGCDGCKRWFHIICAGFKNDREVRTVDRFICRECRPIHGQTTFVRKSSRARTAIDYAGLNQGLVKTATDSYEHHYIQFIKEGKVQCLPENFPRMRPELVTAEFFERGMGMTEPIIIPAELNPRSSVRAPAPEAEYDNLVSEAATQEMFDELLEHLPDTGEPEVVIDCGQDALDMVVPQGLTVRTVAELYGPDERVEVIDVKSQQGEDKRWNMRKWADYYESSGPKVVRNVISLEVSQSPLGKLIRRPKVVRDLDLQDAVWPEELRAVGEWPKVQFYCLMSVADCYTDFHIDFGGSSVYYTILKGKKTFFFIPPRDKHLKKYEEWCNSPSQDTTFLADQTKECYRVDLQEGDTMLIPAGWIHAVWTPENSLVIGGNFLTRLNYGMQIKVAKIEKDTRVPRKFRYPYFQKIQWFAALKYLEEDPIPDSVLEAFARDENYRFYREYPIYYEFGERANTAPRGDPYYNARFYSQAELEGLPELTKYLLRTALIAAGHSVDGVTLETRNAVKRSIPKMSGDPLEVVKKFAVWVAWKRGNERAPSWTRPGAITPNFKVDQSEKRPAGRPSRRSEKHFDSQRMYSERQSVRRLSDSTSERPSISRTVSAPSDQSTPAPAVGGNPSPVIKEETPKPRTVNRGPGLGPKRVACDACRKRRIRCRHKDEADETSDSQALAQDAASVLNALASAATESSGQSLGITSGQMDGAVVNGVNGGKKGRTKACEECRKSKRRCIHDEYGRIDPIKAQERLKPRTGATKRARAEDGDNSPPSPAATKKPRVELVSPTSTTGQSADHHSLQFAPANPVQSPPAEGPEPYPAPANSGDEEHLPAPIPVPVPVPAASAPVLPEPEMSLVSPPTSLAGENEVAESPIITKKEEERESQAAPHTPPPPPPPTTTTTTTTTTSRHSSRQPRPVERYVPPAITQQRSSKPSTSASSSSRKKSTSPGVSRKPPTTPTTTTPKSNTNTPGSKTSNASTNNTRKNRRSLAAADVDPETLRLIRELQEQEFGLRRRVARV